MFGKPKQEDKATPVHQPDVLVDGTELCRVLLIDDDPIQLQIASSALVGGPYHIRTANEGREGLEILKKETFDLLVVDLDMPIMNGFDVIQAVRGELALEQLPIIVVSGNDQISDIERAYDEGATSFLNKPVNWGVFVQHVKFVIRTSQTEVLAVQTAHKAQKASRAKSKVIDQCLHRFGAQLITLEQATRTLASDKTVEPQNNAAIDQLRTVNKAIANTLGSITDTANILSGEVKLGDEPFSLQEMLEEVIHIWEKRICVRFAKPDVIVESVFVRADRKLIQIAVEALLSNVAAHCPPDTAAVLSFADDSKGKLAITLNDNGPGMGPMKGATPSSRFAAESNGLGLTLVRQIMTLHGGELIIQSTPGHGTSLALMFPKSRMERHVHQ